MLPNRKFAFFQRRIAYDAVAAAVRRPSFPRETSLESEGVSTFNLIRPLVWDHPHPVARLRLSGSGCSRCAKLCDPCQANSAVRPRVLGLDSVSARVRAPVRARVHARTAL